MGGHGGLNILPQKKWNIYNRDNRERIERDKAQREIQREQDKLFKIKSGLRGNLMRLKRKKRQSQETGIQSEFTEGRQTSPNPKKKQKKKEVNKSKVERTTEKTFKEMTEKVRKVWYRRVSKERMAISFSQVGERAIKDYNNFGRKTQDLVQLKKEIKKVKNSKHRRITKKQSFEVMLLRQQKREARAAQKKLDFLYK